MKKQKFLQFVGVLVFFVLGSFYYVSSYANQGTAVVLDTGGEAKNCQYTGNSSDYCYASDGSNNLKVLRCKPGTTSCYYDTSAN